MNIPNLSFHRETGRQTPYRPTPLMKETGLHPSILHCELDALALSGFLLRGERPDVKILEIRSGSRPSKHEHSVWTEKGVNF